MSNGGINLISTEKSNLADRNRVLILRSLSLIFLGVVMFVSIILFILDKRISVDSIKNEENSSLQQVSLLKDKYAKYNLLNDRLKTINSLIVSRKNYTSLVDFVISQLPSGVNIRALSIDKEGVLISINSDSLLPINQFLNNLAQTNKKVLSGLTIEGLTIDSQTGLYSLSVKAKPI